MIKMWIFYYFTSFIILYSKIILSTSILPTGISVVESLIIPCENAKPKPENLDDFINFQSNSTGSKIKVPKTVHSVPSTDDRSKPSDLGQKSTIDDRKTTFSSDFKIGNPQNNYFNFDPANFSEEIYPECWDLIFSAISEINKKHSLSTKDNEPHITTKIKAKNESKQAKTTETVVSGRIKKARRRGWTNKEQKGTRKRLSGECEIHKKNYNS
ncbi:hypothetical protein CWI36_0387p0020 [Hamiltosporidium magnivora]|uniref:Uncharacterized protein n=1 Tax=Hamiltosporidium magnivora TaxID=148818 RepID=A0A4Q9LFH8_9MICR|nr:hypothetical protein CWI36_0387p0020 [Hamiltosporidium magnivora]